MQLRSWIFAGLLASTALCHTNVSIADPHVSALGRRESSRHDVRAQHDILVGELVGDLCEIRLRVRNEHVLGLATVDRVAESPAPDRFVAVATVVALRRVPR